ncbi:hypothetical protein [Actinomadura chibensis]|uniref:Uncharacterized protein n=1 Tax=Actinomadura chibensis TaxID=392828 RepID=A0A5D0NTY8_9ACTN|nr:hypothetical protein [Actinomadura chibensis]TYB48160.1 hypothetical protein FXF69_02770 [Actinomadura chibensis]
MTGRASSPRTPMSGVLKAPRSRGMITGLLLMLLALWGGFILFVGPYFSFGFGSTATWNYTNDRLVLSILPAIAVGIGGLILMISAARPIAMVGSWLAIAGGLWFVVGTTIAPLWGNGVGRALGGQTRQIAEHLSIYQGLGAIIVLLAAMALGRFLVVGVREARRAEAGRAAATAGGAGAAERGGRGTAAPEADRAGRGSTAAPEWERRPASGREGERPSETGGRQWHADMPRRR